MPIKIPHRFVHENISVHTHDSDSSSIFLSFFIVSSTINFAQLHLLICLLLFILFAFSKTSHFQYTESNISWKKNANAVACILIGFECLWHKSSVLLNSSADDFRRKKNANVVSVYQRSVFLTSLVKHESKFYWYEKYWTKMKFPISLHGFELVYEKSRKKILAQHVTLRYL